MPRPTPSRLTAHMPSLQPGLNGIEETDAGALRRREVRRQGRLESEPSCESREVEEDVADELAALAVDGADEVALNDLGGDKTERGLRRMRYKEVWQGRNLTVSHSSRLTTQRMLWNRSSIVCELIRIAW